MENKLKNMSSPQKMKHDLRNNVVQDFITKLEKCLLQYRKHVNRRTVLRLGKYIKGNTFHIKILQLGKVRQYKHMFSFYWNKLKSVNKSISITSNGCIKIDTTVESSVAARLENLRTRRKTLEEKEKHEKWDAERILEEKGRREPCTSRAAVAKDEQSKQKVITPIRASSSVAPTISTSLQRSRSFFDKLLSKINRSDSNSTEDITKESNKDDETSSCSSTAEFLGFHENDQVIFKSNENISDNLENKSAFISEELEEFLKENALENCSNITIPIVKFQYEEGMVHSGSEMPTMEVPKQLVKRKARTVAEKRQILESKKDVKYLMVENESTIYWELQRRLKKSKSFSYNLITTIQNQDIPIRRGVWKTAAWLATRSGKFYFQSIEVENDIKNYRINLYGGHGNYDSKLIRLKKPEFKRYNSGYGCNLGCNNFKTYPNLKIDLQEIRYQIANNHERRKPSEIMSRLNLISHQRHLKPGPLSSKVKHDRSGELQIFEMPQIQLDLRPRAGYEFAKDIKKYLNIILPSDRITEEWAKFAVSTLVEPTMAKKGTKPTTTSKQKIYTFDVPYADNQTKVLTRKELDKRIYTPAILKSDLEKEMNTLETPLKVLPKCIDRDDPVQCEIGDYLNDMFNSAVIGLCQNSIMKNDPDLNYNRKDGVQSQLKGKRINTFHDKKVRKNKSKLLNELRRLNATFIETSDASENHECNEEHCTLGCVCTDIRKIPPLHCRKEKCMFECTCKKLEEKAYIQRNAIVEDGLSEEDMKLLRDRATCRLAKMEKDFSSTIVLTNDNTILIHNTQVESKRNRKPSKILKGYSTDDLDKEEEKTVPSPRPSLEKEMSTINLNKYKSIEYMTHCNVVMEKLPELDSLEVWCMVHCLYKCFCNGRATKGDVFGFTDISAKTSQHFPPAPAKRRNYTFDKTDTVQHLASSSKPSTSSGTSARASTSTLSAKSATNGPRTSKVINKTVSESEEELLSRLRIVDYEYYRLKNKAVRRKILKYANAETKLHSLLKQRVNDCLYSKRLNQSKKNNDVVIVLSESDDDKDDGDQGMPAEEKEDEVRESEENQTVESIDDSKQNDGSEEDAVDISVRQVEDCPSTEKERSVTPEANVPNSSASESNISLNPFSHRVPVDKFIQFSQQIDDGIIKSPSKPNCPVKSENVTKLNLIVTKAMSKLCEMQKNNLNDVPDPKPKGFNNISWDNLITIYRQNKVFIWEVRRATKSNNLNLLLVITKTCNMPKIENAVSVVCIKAVRPDDLSVTGKMINLQIINEKTKTLAVLIYGQTDYWLILGCIHSGVNYLEDGVCVRPTPATHPLLATKINRLNTLLCTNPFILQNRNTKTTPIVPLKLSEPMVANPEILSSAPIHKSNIEVVSFSLNKSNSLFLPIPVIGDHRWFMLTIEHDFSDIYIPTWHSFLKYERIVATHKIARSRSKTVRILHMNNEHTVPHVFITPKENNKIFFGPYRVDQDVSMVLCQECDGKMLSREIYEEQTKVNRGLRTTGCWLYVKNNEIVPGKQNQALVKVPANLNSDDDVIFLDEVDTINNKNDCILIEDDDDDQIDPPPQPSSPAVSDFKKVILKPRTPPPNLVAEENKILVKSATEEQEKPTDSSGILSIGDAQLASPPITTTDMTKFSLIPGTKRSKVFSILKPVATKASEDSMEIIFNHLKPGQTTATTVANSVSKQMMVSSPTAVKQVSLLKQQVNGKFLKLKPISQLSICPKQKSLSPPPSIQAGALPTQAKQPPSSSTQINPVPSPVPSSSSTQINPVPSPVPSSSSMEIKPVPSPVPSSSSMQIKPVPSSSSTQINPVPSPVPSSSSMQIKPVPSSVPSPSSTQINPVLTCSPPQPSPKLNVDPVLTDKMVDTLVTIDNDNVVASPASGAARLLNRRKTMDATLILNRMVYNSGSNLNSMLGKRKSNEFLDPMKKPLLNANLKVFKKQAADGAGTAGVPPQEQIKILLKRKKTIQNDDPKFTKIRIIEDPKPTPGKSLDAVSKAIKKLSSTSTYIRSNPTSTVTLTSVAVTTTHTTTTSLQSTAPVPSRSNPTSTIKSTSVAATISHAPTSSIQSTPLMAIRSNATSTVTSTSASTSVAPTTLHASTSSLQSIALTACTGKNTNLNSTLKSVPRTSLDNKQVDNRILNGSDPMKPKDSIISGPFEENDPRLNIKSYIISECANLGKIPCLINKLNITFKLPTMDIPVTLSGLSSLNQFLYRKIRESVHSIIPSDLNFKWSIISDRKKLREIPDLGTDTLNKHKVLTEYGLIDLRANFENHAAVKANPVLLVKLLILQLDRLLNEKVTGLPSRHNAFQILQRTQDYVKQLKSEEAKLMKIKLSLYKEIYHKKNELSKLSEKDEIITPDTNSLALPTAQLPTKRLFLHYGNSERAINSSNEKKITHTLNAKPEVAVVGPAIMKIMVPSETIVIDDDDD